MRKHASLFLLQRCRGKKRWKSGPSGPRLDSGASALALVLGIIQNGYLCWTVYFSRLWLNAHSSRVSKLVLFRKTFVLVVAKRR